ncbi:MAG TPA: TIGR03435 family protein [Vicinamibacterales bacterium]|jgi:uncharacterized protein (TIGR03435 family)|nr:TIGR03435 family protein [Vicinamibacterales bacterium]
MASRLPTKAVLLLITAACALVAASNLSGQGIAFEVVSIKPGIPNSPQVGVHANVGRFNAENASLRLLLQFAFDVSDFQISGGPGWLGSTPFTVAARLPAARVTNADMRQMVVAMLVDRFKLAWHWDTKEADGYDLVVVEDGAKLRETDASYRGSDLTGGNGQLTGRGVPVAQLAASLSRQLGRPVVDRTGLPARYDFTLTYVPETRDAVFGGPSPAEPGVSPSPDTTSIFTALQEQLGLKLQPSQAATRLLAIDRAERPTPD